MIKSNKICSNLTYKNVPVFPVLQASAGLNIGIHSIHNHHRNIAPAHCGRYGVLMIHTGEM